MTDNDIIKEARKRAWLQTRDLIFNAAAAITGTVVSLIMIAILYC